MLKLMRMAVRRPNCVSVALLSLSWILLGCGIRTLQPAANVSKTAIHLTGKVHGGQQPVSGSTIQLYVVGVGGDGSAATPLLTSPVATDANGEFDITGLYQCPSATLVYLTATGGNPGVSSVNPNLSVMALLGPCSSLSSSTSIAINELTTTAAATALGNYMTGPANVGAAPAELPALAAAFQAAQELVSSSDGTVQASSSNGAVPQQMLDTLANIVSACVNTAGGVAGDGSPCGNLFRLTTVAGMPAPVDTVSALTVMVANPGSNVSGLYNLSPAVSPYQPSLNSAPGSFQVSVPSIAAAVVVGNASQLSYAVEIGATQTSKLIVSNNGMVAATLSSQDLLGAGAAAFHADHGCAGTLMPGATCTVSVTWTPVDTAANAAVLALTFSNSFYPLYLPLSAQGMVASAAQTVLFDSTYTAIPTGSNVQGSWQIDPASGRGLVSPASNQGFGTLLSLPFANAAESRSYRLVMRTLTQGTAVGLGFQTVAGEGAAPATSLLMLDTAAGTLNVMNYWVNNNNPGVLSSVPIGFPIVPGQPYVVTVDVAPRKLTLTLLDPSTGLSVSISIGDATTDNGYVPAQGLPEDVLSMVAIAGQFRVDRTSVLVNYVKPHVLFLGDSITYGFVNLDSQGWARMAATAAQGGAGNLTSGRPGSTTVGVLSRLDTEVQLLKPDVVVLLIGSNDAVVGSLQRYQGYMQQIVSKVQQMGSKLVLCIMPPDNRTAASTTTAFNQYLLSLPADGYVRFDLALSANNDGYTFQPNLYVDGTHPNAQGNLMMFHQIQNDLPWLF